MLEQESLEKALESGLPFEKDLTEAMRESVFCEDDLETLQALQKKVEGFEKLLKKRIKGTDLYLKDLEKLAVLKHKTSELELKRSIVNEYTAEYRAKEDKYFELLSFSAHSISGERLWSNAQGLLESSKISFAYSLLNSFLDFYWGYNTAIMREIARAAQWRTMYLSAEKGARLTDKAAKDLPVAYLHLMSWSMYYQSISEMLSSDRPSEEVIENDEQLDEFMRAYQAKVSKEAQATSRKNHKSKGSLSATDKDQVVVTAESRSYVNIHKEDGYSDTSIISGRVNEDVQGDTSYSEIKEKRNKSRDKASKRRQRAKAKQGGVR